MDYNKKQPTSEIKKYFQNLHQQINPKLKSGLFTTDCKDACQVNHEFFKGDKKKCVHQNKIQSDTGCTYHMKITVKGNLVKLRMFIHNPNQFTLEIPLNVVY